MKYLWLLVLVFLAVPVYATDNYSVADAYKDLGHQQTIFDQSAASMTIGESQYLDHLFYVTDLAFRERMIMLRYAESGYANEYIEKYNEEITNILGSFEFIRPNTRALEAVEILVLEAVREQKKLFNLWADADAYTHNALKKSLPNNALVQSSHSKLIKAYQLLKQEYPNESAHNQQAFYDHLCALDFI